MSHESYYIHRTCSWALSRSSNRAKKTCIIISFWMQSGIAKNIHEYENNAQKVIQLRETEGTKALLFVNIWSYDERNVGSYKPKNKTDFLTFLSLMLCWCFEEKQRSFHLWWLLGISNMAGHSFPVSLGLPRWWPCQIPDPGALGQRINVKIPTQGKALSVNFPWVACPHPGA